MAVLVDSASWSAEAGLASVAVYQVELTPHYDSAAALLALVDQERAVIKVEILVVFMEKPR